MSWRGQRAEEDEEYQDSGDEDFDDDEDAELTRGGAVEGSEDEDGSVDEDAEIPEDQVVEYDDDDVPRRKLPLPRAPLHSRIAPQSSQFAPDVFPCSGREAQGMAGAVVHDGGMRELFTDSLAKLMYGAGDERVPLKESVDLLEQMAIDFIIEMTKRAVDVAANPERLTTDDLLFALRDQPRLYSRAMELLDMNKMWKAQRKQISGKDDAFAYASKDPSNGSAAASSSGSSRPSKRKRDED